MAKKTKQMLGIYGNIHINAMENTIENTILTQSSDLISKRLCSKILEVQKWLARTEKYTLQLFNEELLNQLRILFILEKGKIKW